MKRGRGWWRPAPVTAVVMLVALVLVGNLATDTIVTSDVAVSARRSRAT